jgi:glycosyltransferase involved in cell wall biosynthesis
MSFKTPLTGFAAPPRFNADMVRAADKSWPKITIVTPSFNQGRFLEQTILSVLNQNYPNLEYIIMDGGSSDGSVEIIRKYEQYLSYWSSGPDRGQSAAVEAGFRRATGEVFAWINSDDVYPPSVLHNVGEIMQRERQVDVCYGNMHILDAEGQIVAERRLIDYPAWLLKLGSRYGGLGVYQPASFWRRSLYEAVGGLNPGLFFCMDNDLFIRFVLCDGKFKFVRAPLYGFRIHPDSKTGMRKNVADEEFKTLIDKYQLDWTSLRARSIQTAIRFYRGWKHCLQGDGLYLTKRLLPSPLNWVP